MGRDDFFFFQHGWFAVRIHGRQEMSSVYVFNNSINACCDHNENVNTAFSPLVFVKVSGGFTYSLFINKCFVFTFKLNIVTEVYLRP